MDEHEWRSASEPPTTDEMVIVVVRVDADPDGYAYWRLAGKWLPGIADWTIGGLPMNARRDVNAQVVAWQPMPALPEPIPAAWEESP